MRRVLFSLVVSWLLLGSLATGVLGQATGAKNDDISGAWILIEQFPDETHAHRMNLQVAGDKITGQSGSSKIDGTIADAVITLKWLTPDGRVDATYTGKAQAGALKGDGDWGGIKLQWSARRPASRPGSPRTHTFTPTEFHRVFSYAPEGRGSDAGKSQTFRTSSSTTAAV
jgi:hypothetical protein